DKLEHAKIEHADQADTFRDWNDLACLGYTAVAALYAHQAFIKSNFAAYCFDDRLISERDPPVIESPHDFIGRAHILPARRIAFDVWHVGRERTMSLDACSMQRILCAAENFDHRARVARRRYSTDRDGRGNWTGTGEERLVTHTGEQALCRNRQFFRRASRQHHSEFVS